MTVDTIFDDRAVYFPHDRLLVLADLHFGRRTDDPDRPTKGYEDTFNRFRRLVGEYDAEKVIIAGDVFDKAVPVEHEAEETFRGMCSSAAERGMDVIVTPGNHEKEGDFDMEDIEDVDTLPAVGPTKDAGIVVQHGDSVRDERGQLHVVGHVHPGYRNGSIVHDCYVHANRPPQEPDVLILPSFNRTIEGRSLPRVTFGSDRAPLLPSPQLVDRFAVFVWDDEINRAINVDADDQIG